MTDVDDKPSAEKPKKQDEAPKSKTDEVAPPPQENKRDKNVWIENSTVVFGQRPEIVIGALRDVSECTQEEAEKAIEKFLNSPVA